MQDPTMIIAKRASSCHHIHVGEATAAPDPNAFVYCTVTNAPRQARDLDAFALRSMNYTPSPCLQMFFRVSYYPS